MAWARVESKQFNSAVSATTLTWSPAATIPIGTLLLLGYCSNSSSTISTIADNSTQTGTANAYSVSLGTAVGTTLKGGLIWCVTTRSILTTDVITITFLAAATRRSGYLVTFTGQNGSTPVDLSAVATAITTSASNLVMGPTAALAASGELAVGFSFYRGGLNPSGVSDATSGYTLATANAGQADATVNVETNYAWKTTAGTAAETDTQSFSNANLAAAVGIVATFQALVVPAVKRQLVVVRRTWAGR